MFNYRNYIEFAEKLVFLYKDRAIEGQSLLISSILLAWISIESFVNNMIDDFNSLPGELFSLHERAFLLEREIVLIDTGTEVGTFGLGKVKYSNIEDKILFLLRKFSLVEKSFKGKRLWQRFEELKELRNKIVHPRKSVELNIDVKVAEEATTTAKDIIKRISLEVWKKSVEF